jgi:rRNA maturation endonuclease Nob1
MPLFHKEKMKNKFRFKCAKCGRVFITKELRKCPKCGGCCMVIKPLLSEEITK